MIISSESYRQLAKRAPATIQAERARYDPVSVDSAKPAASHGHMFSAEAGKALGREATTGMIELDCSVQLGTRMPATTRNLLARYLVIKEDEELELDVKASSALFFVVKGKGRSFAEDEVIEWNEGDAFLMPGGVPILNEAPHGDTVLFVVTDEPLFDQMACTPASLEDTRFRPAHFVANSINAQIADIATKAGEGATQHVLQFGSSRAGETACVTPMMAAGVATLVGGAEQSPHCHDADTLSVVVSCEKATVCISEETFDCTPGIALLTPGGAVHTVKNDGETALVVFYVQDRGPRTVRTWVPQIGS